MNRIKPFILLLFATIYLSINSISQNHTNDSLRALLINTNSDTSKVSALLSLSRNYLNLSTDTALNFAIEARNLSEKINDTSGKAQALKSIGMGYYLQGKYILAMDYWRQSLSTFQSIGDTTGIANLLNNLGIIHYSQGDDTTAIKYYLQSLGLSEKLDDKQRKFSALNNIASIYYQKQNWDTALNYFLQALPVSEEAGNTVATGYILANVGEIYSEKKDDARALEYFGKSIKVLANNAHVISAYNGIGKLYLRKGNIELALKYHKEALVLAEKLDENFRVIESLMGLANVYNRRSDLKTELDYYNRAEILASESKFNHYLKDIYEAIVFIYEKTGDYRKAFIYHKRLADTKGTLFEETTEKKLSGLQFLSEIKAKDQIEQLYNEKKSHEIEVANLKYKNKLRVYYFLSGLLVLILIAAILLHNNRQQKKAKTRIEQAYTELKSMQAQLIQSEKMASLGELTAGIAHEIQNPLNFVNNFSDVNKELLIEMNSELEKGNLNEAKIISKDVIENEEKVNHHGKRAEAIVKNMLQHSRRSSGKKEATDINALADEYLRLAFHGLRARDKSFNATMKTDFDESIGNIKIIPQDIGRVILNLINNAFYAVDEKRKKIGDGYEPNIVVSTRRNNGIVEIKVGDNGNGIPQKILDKIFQPFFSTKPTGQGTGLGLSLSYDIVKAHGGEIRVTTKENEGSAFIISLPNN